MSYAHPRDKYNADIKNGICPDCGNTIQEVEGCLICNKCEWGQEKEGFIPNGEDIAQFES